MHKKEIGTFACKTLGIFLIIQGTNSLSNILYYLVTTPEIFDDGFAGVAFSLAYIGFGVLLWLFAGKLSAIMMKQKEHGDRGEAISAGDLQRIAFSVLGLYFIGHSLPRFVSSLANLHVSFRGLPDSTAMFVLAFGGPITEFIIGIGLFFGSQGLVNLLHTLRKAGPARGTK